MYRATRACLTYALALALGLAVILAAPPPALAGAWQVELGQPWEGYPDYYSVAWLGRDKGFVMGSYAGGLIARSGPSGAAWEPDWLALPLEDRPDHESVSLFLPTPWGFYVGTEDADGPQVWEWRAGRLELVASIGGGIMYALGGPEAAAFGLVPLSTGHMRQVGAYIAGPDGRPLTPPFLIGDTPPVMWTATVAPAGWPVRYVAGCSLGENQYLKDGVGRLGLYDGHKWRLAELPAPMAGITRLTHHPSYPGSLFVATTHGQVWLAHGPDGPWELYHDTDTGWQHGASVHDWRGRVVVSNAAGGVWCDGAEVARIEGATFMSLAKGYTPAGEAVFVGPAHKDGRTVPVRIKPE